jgi:hypothetical protein
LKAGLRRGASKPMMTGAARPGARIHARHRCPQAAHVDEELGVKSISSSPGFDLIAICLSDNWNEVGDNDQVRSGTHPLTSAMLARAGV